MNIISTSKNQSSRQPLLWPRSTKRLLDRRRLIAAAVSGIVLAATMLFQVARLQAQDYPKGIRLDSNGWTIFNRSADTRVIYVSSSTGNDANNGLSEHQPVKSIAKGVSLLRTGFPDWLLLKKGDTWVDERIGVFIKHGRSPTEPMLISSYGTGDRPVLRTKDPVFITSHNNNNGDNLAIVGLEFYAYTRDPNSQYFVGAALLPTEETGLSTYNPITWFLVEDCKFSLYSGSGIGDPDGTSSNVIIRRNVIVDSYNNKAGSSGLYIDKVTSGLIIEENLFDHNGWNSSVRGASASMLNHNLYLTLNDGPVIVRENIFANASSHGAQVRPGGIVNDNLFVNNPIGVLVGKTESTVSNNVFVGGNDIMTSQGAQPRGWAIDINPATGPIKVFNNIIAHQLTHGGHGISMAGATDNITAINNIFYHWDHPIDDRGTDNVTSPNEIDRNDYVDPNRTVETYNAFIGGEPSLSAFLDGARKQSKSNWHPELTAHAVNEYIRAGFKKK